MRLFLAALTLVMVTTPAMAQWIDRKTPNIPRSADGKPNLTAPAPRGPDGKPDLNGVWNGPAPQARPDRTSYGATSGPPKSRPPIPSRVQR